MVTRLWTPGWGIRGTRQGQIGKKDGGWRSFLSGGGGWTTGNIFAKELRTRDGCAFLRVHAAGFLYTYSAVSS